MSCCISDAAGMVRTWARNPGAAFSNGWGQGGPLLTPASPPLRTHYVSGTGGCLSENECLGWAALAGWSLGRRGQGRVLAD